jgi:hypothetical protein
LLLQVSNQALADEKTRTDVLLARQYNLISLMAQQGMFGGGGSSCGASALHEKTLGAACTAAAVVAEWHGVVEWWDGAAVGVLVS